MLSILKLIIPALMPSWNFFDIITASPRVQISFLQNENEEAIIWQEFRPRPVKLTLLQQIKRLLWNAHWNETMYIACCAERLGVNPTEHSENEILNRIINDINHPLSIISAGSATHVQFRLVFIERQGDELVQEVSYLSQLRKLPAKLSVKAMP